MPSPIDSLRFVHAAILAEGESVERAVAGATGPSEAGALADRIEEFGELVDGHTRGEEIGLFPPLVDRDEAIAETYLFDHVEERERFAELVALARASGAGDEAALTSLRREVVALVTHTRSHVAKENELILPRVAALFTPEEQAQMVSGILSAFTPEQTAAGVPWIVDRLDVSTAAAYVNALSRAMPPPVFEAAKEWIHDGIRPDHWDALIGHAPVLV